MKHFYIVSVEYNSDSQCSRILPMKATIMSVHCDCERTVFKEVGWIDNMLKASLRIQDIVSKCDTTPKVVQNQKKHSQ